MSERFLNKALCPNQWQLPPSEGANVETSHKERGAAATSSGDPIKEQDDESPGQTNIALLSRGLRLLAIAQLRQLLQEYSIPTGGNKQSLVSRLIMYLETFGPSQQNLLVQFSLKLKRLLSSDAREKGETQIEDSPMQLLPPEVSDKLGATSPSCLFEVTDHQLAFGPVMVQSKMPGDVLDFTLLNQNPGCTPVLQIAPVFLDSPLKGVTLQISSQVHTLSEPSLWMAIPDVINKPTSLQVTNVSPAVPIVIVIRWMKRVSVERLVQMVVNQKGGLVDVPGAPVNGICPLTMKVISTPARSLACAHNECFDLTGYLARAFKTNDWMCPICHKPVSPEEIRIDFQYFLKSVAF